MLRDTAVNKAALGQTISWPVVAPGTVADIAPAATGPAGNDMTVAAPTTSISKAKSVVFYLTGEELKESAPDLSDQVIIKNTFAQAFRSLANLIEIDLWTTAYQNASRAYGTPTTVPFGTAGDLTDLSNTRRMLEDDGAPTTNLHLVLSSTGQLRQPARQAERYVLFKVNEAGTEYHAAARDLGTVEGVALHQSGAITQLTKGTGTSYVTNGSTAPGVTSIALITGTGTVLGDVVTFARRRGQQVRGQHRRGCTSHGGFGRPGGVGHHCDLECPDRGRQLHPADDVRRQCAVPGGPHSSTPPGGDAADDAMTLMDPFPGCRSKSGYTGSTGG